MAIGQDITIWVGGLVVGRARTCNYTEPSTIVDVSAMDDAWDDKEAGSQSWTMSIEKIWTPAHADYAALRAAKAAGNNITAKWIDGSGRGRHGTTLVAEMSEDWSRDEPIISRIELVGVGAPTDDPDYAS